MMIHDGWLDTAIKHFSDNFDSRPEGVCPEAIILHCISLPPGEYQKEYITDFFLNRLQTEQHEYFQSIQNLQVSSHFLIRRHGQILQYVSTEHRAWHAGQSLCLERASVNDFSIGIELEGWDEDPEGYSDKQYQQLRKLIQCLKQRYTQIKKNNIFAHSDIAPLRKNDPGQYFDWGQIMFTHECHSS